MQEVSPNSFIRCFSELEDPRIDRKKFKDISIKGLRKKAGWGDRTLNSILMESFGQGG